ncbi:MAG: hypothetical protein Q9217_004537 [Psora testacea]
MTSNSGFTEIKDGISTALVDTTRTVGQISNEDLAFHRSSNPAVVPLLDRQSSRLLQLAKRLTKVATSGTEVAAPEFSDADSIDDSWRGIVDIFDNLLEKADACLDEYTGVIKRLSLSQEEQIDKAAAGPTKQNPGKAYQSQDISKPQLHFKHAPRNHEKSAFKPLLTSKPHALIPLAESLQVVPSEHGFQKYKHPYETEIKAAQTPVSVHVVSEPIPYLPYESTAATWVETPEGVQNMLEELKQAKEIAIDLEHHEEHSYLGLVSLMQISTRKKDWVVDTLRPWRQDLQVLNEVFTDPRILKVFHGSTMDMIWLQRDLGLYVVGLFDTYHASLALGYPKRSLAFLLKKFVDFDAAKQYQMADWRIRPLPKEMFNYARSDTHFLLYIYDMMRNELIEKSDLSQPDGDLIENVMENSKKESLQQYDRPLYDEQRGSGPLGWYSMLSRTPALFNREQFAVFRAVHQWRDQVAREEDESLNTIMPKRVLYSIARETPTDMASLLGCSHPMSKPYQKRKEGLLQMVKQAKAAGATGPEMRDFMLALQSTGLHASRGGITIDDKAMTYDKGAASVSADLRSNGSSLVRSDTSAFWGNIPKKTLAHKFYKGTSNFHLALPLPELTAEVFVDTETAGNANTTSQSNSSVRAEHQDAEEKPAEADIFIVRESSRPKKRKAADAQLVAEPKINGHLEDDAHNDEPKKLALEGDDPETEKRRAERKREKHERRLGRQRLRQEQGYQAENVGNGPEAEPFDYENAPSDLHAKKAQNVKTSTSKPANPYAKSLDAPKGMRKSQKEAAGKSFTFKM